MTPRDAKLIQLDAFRNHKEVQYNTAREDFAVAIEALRKRLDELPIDVDFPDISGEMRRAVT
jgi:hypothetical protein